MDALDIFLKKYSYKFPKGYPDMNNEQDILLMESILNELGVDLDEDQSESHSELSSLINDTSGKDKKLSKLKSYTELSKLTYDQYDLGDIRKVFPDYVNTIENWEQYMDETDKSNKGRVIEHVLKNYSIAKGVDSKEISGQGEDISIGGKIIEVKSNQGNTINTQLQTSFYTTNPNKFYAFVSNTLSKDLQVRIVASKILYKLALGDEIADEIESKGGSDVLVKQIEDGLKTLDLKKFILSSILTGKTSKDGKSFFIGKDNKVRCRFVIYIEPK